MPDSTPSPAGRRRRWIGGTVALIVVLVLIVVLGIVRQNATDAPTSTPTTASPSMSQAPTMLAAPTAPFSRIDTASLTVPEETRFAAGEFAVIAGATYLVTFALDTEKPEGSDGYAMYLGVTFSCAPQGDDGGASVGGTQNLLTGEPTTYRNQLLLTPTADSIVSCTIKASAPYDDVASAGTSFEMTGQWKADRVDGLGFSAAADERLPMTIPSGDGQVAFAKTLPVEDLTHERLRVLTSLHVTACTVVNGSSEVGRTWCTEDALDEAGSTVSSEIRVEVLGANGTVCEVVGAETAPEEHVDLYRHHQLLFQETSVQVPAAPCGQSVRVTVSVQNSGPAPLVVHQNNSSLVVVGE